MSDLVVLAGTGDSLGIPRAYCDCTVCTEARTSGQNKRTRCSAFVKATDQSFWIDCSPDWKEQMETLKQRSIATILITHAHHDHIGGLPDVADVSRWTKTRPHIVAPDSVLYEIKRRFPWIERNTHMELVSDVKEVGGYQLTSWKVCHGANGYSYAYRFDSLQYRWAYCTDCICLNEVEQAPLIGLDLLILGTSYYHETAPIERRSLYDITEALELIEVVRPKLTILTHISHGVDIAATYGLGSSVVLGRDGLEISLKR